MSDHSSAAGTPPVVRSSVDVALWFVARAEEARVFLPAKKLQQLMYLAQAVFSGRAGARKLMPATFLAGEQGPYEPTILIMLDAGLATTPKPMIAKSAKSLLEIIWREYGVQTPQQLARLIAADGLWRATFERGANSEITIEAMRRAYAPARSARGPERPSEATTVRFTLDGRPVVKWAPKRRIERPAASVRGT